MSCNKVLIVQLSATLMVCKDVIALAISLKW